LILVHDVMSNHCKIWITFLGFIIFTFIQGLWEKNM
jgi:hypothetical protein